MKAKAKVQLPGESKASLLCRKCERINQIIVFVVCCCCCSSDALDNKSSVVFDITHTYTARIHMNRHYSIDGRRELLEGGAQE